MSKEIKLSDVYGLYHEIVGYIQQARQNVLKSVNYEQGVAYWQIGRRIVEQEQLGEDRANYGKALLERLSEKLKKEFGRDFGSTNLRYMRQFYLVYPTSIHHEARDEFNLSHLNPDLSWTHYRLLMRETRDEVRKFYEIEAGKNH